MPEASDDRIALSVPGSRGRQTHGLVKTLLAPIVDSYSIVSRCSAPREDLVQGLRKRVARCERASLQAADHLKSVEFALGEDREWIGAAVSAR